MKCRAGFLATVNQRGFSKTAMEVCRLMSLGISSPPADKACANKASSTMSSPCSHYVCKVFSTLQEFDVGTDEHNNALAVHVRMMVVIRFCYCLYKLSCITFSELMHFPQIHGNKSFIGLYLQSVEYAMCTGQDNVVCWAASASPRSRASKARLVKEPETPTGKLAFSSTCRKLSVLALSTLDNFCCVLLPVREQNLVPSCRWCVLEGLPGRWRGGPLAAFYLIVADLLSGCYVVSPFPFLCVCEHREPLVKAERFELEAFGPP